MKKILVSLVSEQTIPNILAIDHIKPDKLLFLSTIIMEKQKKTDAILKTLKKRELDYTDNSSTLIVDEYSIHNCHKKIEQWITGKEDSEFIVNLTGGTKIMSIAAYEYFKDYGSKMIYIPIPKNEFIVPFPIKSSTPPTQLNLRLKVIEYLTAYGLDIINEHKIEGYKNEAIKRKDISKWIVLNYHKIKNLLCWFSKTLRDKRNKKWYEFKKLYNSPTQEDLELLDKLNFSLSNGYVCKKLSRSEIVFLTGGWLEEYCFNEIFELSGRYVDDVVVNISPLSKEGTTNEFDVMFTKDNALYFVECKSLDQSAEKGTSDLYKIGALQKEFGLRIKSFFVSTSRDILKEGQIKKGLKERGEQFNTEIIHPDEIINLSNFFS